VNLDYLLPMAIAAENVQRLLDGQLTAPPHEGTLAARVWRELPEPRRRELIGSTEPTDARSA
jgi:hypothetical protein